jgi:sugar phosphate isomerase/epimerase
MTTRKMTMPVAPSPCVYTVPAGYQRPAPALLRLRAHLRALHAAAATGRHRTAVVAAGDGPRLLQHVFAGHGDVDDGLSVRRLAAAVCGVALQVRQ